MNRNRKLKLNRFLATGVMAGAVMLSAVPVQTFAASDAAITGVQGEQPDSGAQQTVTVGGLKSGSVVKLYQIVDGYYKDKKLVRYVLMDPVNANIAAIGNDEKGQTDGTNDIITEDEITTIANNIQSGAFTADRGVDMSVNGSTATLNVEPGLYMVLATDPSGEMVYNPAVVAVNITNVNSDTRTAGNIDMTKYFKTGAIADGGGVNVYLKSSKSDADKKITGSDKKAVIASGEHTGKYDPINSYGDTLAIGDTAHFRIDGMTIPSFSADYTNPQYIITDTIDDSFDTYTNLKVNVGGADVPSGAGTYTVSANGHAFKITFAKEYLMKLRGTPGDSRKLVVTYDAVLNGSAGLNFAENHNRATIQYSNNPSDEAKFRTINKDTYHYTFGIDAALDGENGNEKITYEYNKTTNKHDRFADQKSNAPLAGAEFTLYTDENCTSVAKPQLQSSGTVASDNDGHITFTGLDEGTYYLKETKAPDGYTLSDPTYKFVIKADINADGSLKGYSVKSSFKDATHPTWTDAGTATYTATQTTKAADGSLTYQIQRGTGDNGAIAIKNSKLQRLPSTGGRGTVAITLIASISAAGFLTLFLKSRKKDDKTTA